MLANVTYFKAVLPENVILRSITIEGRYDISTVSLSNHDTTFPVLFIFLYKTHTLCIVLANICWETSIAFVILAGFYAGLVTVGGTCATIGVKF